MYLNKDVATVIEKLPHKKSGTSNKALIGYLLDNCIICAPRFTPLLKKTLPHTALVRIRWPDKKHHIVLKAGDIWHDPIYDRPFAGTPPGREYLPGGIIVSFLELK